MTNVKTKTKANAVTKTVNVPKTTANATKHVTATDLSAKTVKRMTTPVTEPPTELPTELPMEPPMEPPTELKHHPLEAAVKVPALQLL